MRQDYWMVVWHHAKGPVSHVHGAFAKDSEAAEYVVQIMDKIKGAPKEERDHYNDWTIVPYWDKSKPRPFLDEEVVKKEKELDSREGTPEDRLAKK